MYVCMYICMYVCVFSPVFTVCTYECTNIRMYVMYVYILLHKRFYLN